ncbi:patatin-like phospholipase family protein [Ulvibacterium sp.]|uniref:patatin-like phospholipase family protein n=1 Tax=Ulvibacterium sp. TaxID=2665914 RepID=UPI003BAAC780
MPTRNKLPSNPLNRIAVCLSGGGYRAASFQLGTLSYLNSKKFGASTVLKNVKAISTVSGGTITGVYYTLQIQRQKAFEVIFNELKDWLSHTDLVKKGLKKLNENGTWKHQYKRRNLINAFSELYDETLLDGATISDLKSLKNGHLEFVCFNSTEFNRGLRYRFQTGEGRIFFGSDGLQLGKNIYSEFRLGDVIEASSAFSGGFEPIAMPEDFLASDTEAYKAVKLKKGYREAVGLMDGGIYDNQGITGIEDYEDNKGVRPFDLILISDVSSPYITDFDFSIERSGGIREKTIVDLFGSIARIRRITLIFILSIYVLGISLMLHSQFINSTILGIGIALTGMGVVFTWIFYLAHKLISKLYRNAINYILCLIPKYFRDRLSSFDYKNTKIKRLELLLLDRINSLKLLLPGIFLKQIRRLHYERLYENKKYENRRATCVVRQLTKEDFEFKRSKNLDNLDFLSEHIPDFKEKTFEKIVGEKIASYTEKAADFGTTLWFTEEDKVEEQLKCLIISGQITCCHSLLIYLTNFIYDPRFPQLEDEVKESVIELQKDVLQDWRKYKTHPEFLFEELTST